MTTASEFTTAKWRKSTGSGDGNCVEVASVAASTGVRDSKVSDSPVLVTAHAEWRGFLNDLREGAFDL
ncbi:DUF397 domain-containing protein [Phytomonospora sp. NPDC050363]|uniref:DUF397 domain-containing protein n=1 Tax=Phytomonospora sp. NPDC050363 TaxID=3155642 RepID=UPI00340E9C4E